MTLQTEAIDRVIQDAIQMMDDSKYAIFEICESAREELQAVKNELEEIKLETIETIENVDKLERQFRLARAVLSEVSRDFNKYTEQDIKDAYEKATVIQMDIMIFREKESNLKVRRNELQKRTKNLQSTVSKAENVTSQINVAVDYLSGDLSQITKILESVKNRQLVGLRIILAQEEERKRIAREIHDGMAQSMANLILRTEIAERMMEQDKPELAKAEIVDLKQQVRSNLEEVRKIIFNLRPMALDDLGLLPTLRKFVHDFEEKYNIKARITVNGKEERLPSAMEVAIFRLVQETFSNVKKHAKATQVNLEMRFQKNFIYLVIEDNGIGFEVEKVEDKISEGDNYGIIGMRERVELLEGKFNIQTAPDQGTKMFIQVPVKPDSKERGDL
ncbi:sensor histidine kinase [Longirhabdus pacifica]|uniref:sensor histidine kinase n=1 Tax=Longirhabdus pacifica TaxID=2305227 RepID=UPI001F0C1A23|nr:sensor histidine kinase [Longirhabdus pacifica]